MNQAATIFRHAVRRMSLVGTFLVALALSSASDAQAQFVNGSYAIAIGESARALEAQLQLFRGEITQLKYNQIIHEESCKNPSIRMHDRNRVALMLQNTSGNSAALSSFTIDLQEMGFEFGTGDVPTDGFNGQIVMDSNRSDAGVTFSALYGDNNTDPTKLVINFDGLTDNKAAIFRIDLDPVPLLTNHYPDYRGILMGANVGNGPTTAANITGVFTMDDTSTPTATIPFSDFDPPMQDLISTSGVLEVYHLQAGTMIYQHGGRTIPEPTSGAMLAIGIATLAVRRRRGRRS